MNAAPVSCFAMTSWTWRPTVCGEQGKHGSPTTPNMCLTPASARASMRYSATLHSATTPADGPSPVILESGMIFVVPSATENSRVNETVARSTRQGRQPPPILHPPSPACHGFTEVAAGPYPSGYVRLAARWDRPRDPATTRAGIAAGSRGLEGRARSDFREASAPSSHRGRARLDLADPAGVDGCGNRAPAPCIGIVRSGATSSPLARVGPSFGPLSPPFPAGTVAALGAQPTLRPPPHQGR